MKVQKAILLLGGNQGNVRKHFVESIAGIDRNIGRVFAQSRIYKTKAWGPVAQTDFLNIAVMIYTSLPPAYLLKQLLDIEKQFGRKREIKYGPRTLDIDILFYGNKIVSRKELSIPHPEVQNRRFALVPVNDIAPSFIHPLLHQSMAELLKNCKDELEVSLWKV